MDPARDGSAEPGWLGCVGATLQHAGNGWVFSNANGGWEYPVFLIAASLVHALLGDGRYALRPEHH